MRRSIWLILGAVNVVALVIAVALLIALPRMSGPPPDGGSGPVSLDLVAEGLEHPVAVALAEGVDDRAFIVDQVGVVYMLMSDGTLDRSPFLDVRDRMMTFNPSSDERGLLSIAFHPDYRENRKLYAFYTAPLREGAPRAMTTPTSSRSSPSPRTVGPWTSAPEGSFWRSITRQPITTAGRSCSGRMAFCTSPPGTAEGRTMPAWATTAPSGTPRTLTPPTARC